MSRTIIIIVLLLWSARVPAQINHERGTRLTDDWEFLRQDLGHAWEAVRPREAGTPVPRWERVTIPHCFNATDAVDADVNYYQGPGWYRTFITVDNPYSNGRTLLHFEGAGQTTDVYINTERVITHVGGYDEWQVDITEAIKRFFMSGSARRFDGRVPLVIRCDNSRDTGRIPSDLSDFNLYGGLYRHVNLVYAPAIAFDYLATRATVDAAGKRGELTISVGLKTYISTNDVQVTARVFNPRGKLVREITRGLQDNSPVIFTLEINRPDTWSPDTPYLYTCEMTLRSLAGTTTCREYFGFRHADFLEGGPFLLNGKRLALRGTLRHEDHAGVGAAMSDEMIVRELALVKSMGANLVRLAHYQQSRLVLQECDRVGLLVWEEIPWGRGDGNSTAHREQAREALTSMITQHRNHPSIVLWGIGSEIDWSSDFLSFEREPLRALARELHELARRLDDTRPTVLHDGDFCRDIPDVYSPATRAGWGEGHYTDFRSGVQRAMQGTPRVLPAGWGSDSHAGRYARQRPGEHAAARDTAFLASRDGDRSDTYACDLVDWYLQEQERMPTLAGTVHGAFKDFSSPTRPDNPVPYVNQMGVVERDLALKETYHVFRSYWADSPVLHVHGHASPTRWGTAGEIELIKVYSNCDEVELFLNGKSLGVKRRVPGDFPASGLRWETALAAGRNVVRAVGWKGDKRARVELHDEISFHHETRVPGQEASIVVRVTEVDAGHAWIEAELVDKQGITCYDSRARVRFDMLGEGRLLVDRGTSSGARVVQAVNGRARVMFEKGNGKANVLIRVEGVKSIIIEVNR
jgi:beta-galactosidase